MSNLKFLLSLVSASALALGGCALTPQSTALVAPLEGPPSLPVETDYSQSLDCLAQYVRAQDYSPPRMAVGHIMDLTGAQDSNLGRRLTQGATLMAMTAAARSGMRLVERFDMSVTQVELDYANRGLLRDAPSRLRTTTEGQMEGTDLYLVGGITEFNPNISSSGVNFYAGANGNDDGALSLERRNYVFDVAIDLRLIDVRSTEVIAVRSFRKQIRGIEYEAGAFGIVSGALADAGAGRRALEPTQSVIRGMIERAVFEFMSELYGGQALECAPERRVVAASPEEVDLRGYVAP